jgi:hypothetical protein
MQESSLSPDIEVLNVFQLSSNVSWTLKWENWISEKYIWVDVVIPVIAMVSVLCVRVSSLVAVMLLPAMWRCCIFKQEVVPDDNRDPGPVHAPHQCVTSSIL